MNRTTRGTYRYGGRHVVVQPAARLIGPVLLAAMFILLGSPVPTQAIVTHMSRLDDSSPARLPPVATIDIWQPAIGTTWQIQLQGKIDTSYDVDLYLLDLFDTPQATIDALHDEGRRVVCYFSAGTWEDWRSDADQFPTAIIGTPLEDWPGEKWLDIRSATTRTRMAARLDLAVQKQCDGVDPDNVQVYLEADPGFDLTAADQLDYNRWLAEAAHARGMAVGLKNGLLQIPQLVDDFDWILNEECYQYDECNLLRPFIAAGKAVLIIEYQGQPATLCPQAAAEGFSLLFKDLDLLSPVTPCVTTTHRLFAPLLRYP